MARQVQSMSDTQLKLMTKAAVTMQSAARGVQKARAFLASRAALVVAVVVLLIALLLRYLGVM